MTTWSRITPSPTGTQTITRDGISGTVTAELVTVLIEVENDNANVVSPAVGMGLEVTTDLGTAGTARGQRYAIRGASLITSAGNATTGDTVGVSGIAQNTQRNGGSDLASLSAGAVYGMEAQGRLSGSATYYSVCSGGEAFTNISSTASAKYRWGWSIVGAGATRGGTEDAALHIGATALPYTTGVIFSSANGVAPLPTTGTAIGTDGNSVTATNFADLHTYTFTGDILYFDTFRVTGAGNLTAKTVATTAPTTQTGATYTVGATDSSIIADRAGTVTLTLLSAATYPGRWLYVKTVQAQTVVSASSNVVPLIGGSAGTAILAATAGKWAALQSDGTNWVIMAAA